MKALNYFGAVSAFMVCVSSVAAILMHFSGSPLTQPWVYYGTGAIAWGILAVQDWNKARKQ